MKWVRRYIESKRPKYTGDLGFLWPLFTTKRFSIGLAMRFRSDTTFDQPCECSWLRWVIEGEYIEHQELPRIGEHTPAVEVEEGAYVYSNDFGLFMARTITTRQITIEPAGRRGGIELLAPRDTADRLVDFGKWMHKGEEIFDAERPVVYLMICWGVDLR